MNHADICSREHSGFAQESGQGSRLGDCPPPLHGRWRPTGLTHGREHTQKSSSAKAPEHQGSGFLTLGIIERRDQLQQNAAACSARVITIFYSWLFVFVRTKNPEDSRMGRRGKSNRDRGQAGCSSLRAGTDASGGRCRDDNAGRPTRSAQQARAPRYAPVEGKGARCMRQHRPRHSAQEITGHWRAAQKAKNPVQRTGFF